MIYSFSNPVPYPASFPKYLHIWFRVTRFQKLLMHSLLLCFRCFSLLYAIHYSLIVLEGNQCYFLTASPIAWILLTSGIALLNPRFKQIINRIVYIFNCIILFYFMKNVSDDSFYEEYFERVKKIKFAENLEFVNKVSVHFAMHDWRSKCDYLHIPLA